MTLPADQQYLTLMTRIRGRFHVINKIRESGQTSFSAYETIAFHLRKVVEGIAFGCLVACDNGLKTVPRDASGQWNADNILVRLNKRGALALPNPSVLRPPETDDEKRVAKFVVQGIPEKCLTVEALRHIYRDSHGWLHELNPYVHDEQALINRTATSLIADTGRIYDMLESHFISISGQAFFCLLQDPADGETRVFSASKDLNA